MNAQDALIQTRSLLDVLSAKMEDTIVQVEQQAHDTRPLLLAVDAHNFDAGDTNYQLDLAMQKAAPVAVVPLHAEFARLAVNGHRFLLAADGLYLEVRRPWLYFVHKLCSQTDVTMPYGRIEPVNELAFGRLGNILDLLRTFATDAIINAPNEHADMLIWNYIDQKVTQMAPTITDATPSSLRYELRPLAGHESIAVDLHSHGHLPAFFSPTDDADDAGSVKISGVFGNLNSDTPTAVFRLCVLGLYIPINVPAERIFKGL